MAGSRHAALTALAVGFALAATFASAQQTSTMTFQTGRILAAPSGAKTYYNSTFDISISTQYADSWNDYNGMTYFWPSPPPDYSRTVSDVAYGGDKFRALLRFGLLHRYLPPGASVQAAALTLSFLNWNAPVLLEACYMHTQWAYVDGPRFKTTGWRYARYNGTGPVPWSEPGGWADCAPSDLVSLVLPGNGAYGFVQQTLELDPARVAGWLANNGTGNWGLLLRAVNGSVSLLTSQWAKDASWPLRRPALSVTCSTDPALPQPTPPLPLTTGAIPRVWWVATDGSDDTGSGHEDAPFLTPAKAVFEAWPGDSIYLKTGVYPGGINMERSRITLRSAPGHWATIALRRDDPQNNVNVITLRPGADYGVIRDLEISGGYYYGIMFFTSWENYGTMAERVAKGAAPSHWLISNVRIHDTGGSGAKLTMKAINNTFASCEIYNTGSRLRTGGHGIEAVQVRAGGAKGSLLERNFVTRTGFGFNVGFNTDYEYMDPVNNPKLFEAIGTRVVNNIITSVHQAGINAWAAANTVIAHNTIWQAQEHTQSAVLLNTMAHSTPSGPSSTPCANLSLLGNLLVRSPTARAGPVFQIRAGGLDPATPLVMGANVYYDRGSAPETPFRWGKGAMLEDERTGMTFVGNAPGWAAHCSAALAQPSCDVGSLEADPSLDPAYSPLACSPALARVPPAHPTTGAQLVTDDFHGRPRSGAAFDAGAVQADGVGAAKPMPPVPPAFAAQPAFAGTGPSCNYDRQWPFDFWRTRTCKDLVVDAVAGNDAQAFNYDSNYAPFKTIQKALISINQCDRILLRGGQNHVGGFGIYRPNVTITTHPADLPARAKVVCIATGAVPCIRTGEGFYGGAAALNLYGFDVQMGPTTTGSCIHLNEGSGGGTSAYWSYYLPAAGKGGPGPSLIRDMALTRCGLHGIKLSTFVRGVTMQDLTITSPRMAGIEVRGGGDLVIARNTLTNISETAIRLGGGARNVLVERNLIRNFGGRGILLGSDSTEVATMDVDWALAQPTPGGDWHDCVNAVVVNNVIDGGMGAGVAFYSARDAFVAHNTILNVAGSMQAGVLLNVSPKLLSPFQETAAPNTNITFTNNIITLGGDPSARLMVEARIMQAGMAPQRLPDPTPPAATCPARRHHRRLLRGLLGGAAAAAGLEVTPRPDGGAHAAVAGAGPGAADAVAVEGVGASDGGALAGAARRELAGLAFAQSTVDAPGEQGRNADGSCPMFPDDNWWHLDVTALPVHPLSDAIKARIGGGSLHPDFGGGANVNGQFVHYGIPYIKVDSAAQAIPQTQVVYGPAGYPDESDVASGQALPLPADAPVEGAYANCPLNTCKGDRHVVVWDQATCLLTELYRAVPPTINGGKWQADQVSIFNTSRNGQGRALGWTSADAAGLPILPGLVKYAEAVNGSINHAIRFTGPNSRAAYAPPATHFAPAGDSYNTASLPYMGMRIRLKASFDCTPLLPVARAFCVALKKYGGIFADNGGPWYFSGEATASWDSVISQVYDISKIPSSALEVLDTGCMCLTQDCTIAECGGIIANDPSALPVYPALADTADLHFAANIYHKQGAAARFVDRRVDPPGVDGGLAAWQDHLGPGGDAGSVEADPLVLDRATYRPAAGSPALGSVPKLAQVGEDLNGSPRPGPVGAPTDAGAVLGA
ncbi:hypothetical protein HYH03_000046 [Edaphochlamys debaryana]|uniref:Right handed beta helix domain-containing protein n=1 Tax=Edaphochlamys debaryana TaxID=47281 RepID=A0A835YGV8_9CHLO|nr:hypothetical protein HYH03_000046 [Edaphochlamys debaryana]|eukprot:KAG2501539.1 hypothetical protein HYH03_000046 [Edaphochlamys debaryana]